LSRTDLTAARLAPQPADYSIDAKGKQVRVKFGKKLNAAAIGSYASQLAADPSFHPDFSEIVDLRDVEEADLQADDFLKLADKIDPFSPTAKRAFVVQTVTQQHAARMHQILRSERNIAIFSTIEEAEIWIAS
jgi:hypothetical protein